MLTRANLGGQHAPQVSGIPPGGGKVRCPFCHRDTLSITNSRLISDSPLWIVRRVRHCDHCHRNFPTYEMLESVYADLEKGRQMLTDFRKLITGKSSED